MSLSNFDILLLNIYIYVYNISGLCALVYVFLFKLIGYICRRLMW